MKMTEDEKLKILNHRLIDIVGEETYRYEYAARVNGDYCPYLDSLNNMVAITKNLYVKYSEKLNELRRLKDAAIEEGGKDEKITE